MSPKMAKDIQTDYTKGGKAISDTAIPLYTQGLNQLGEYTQNIQNRLDPYMQYAELGTASNTSDLMRQYQKEMARVTGNQYQATGGGFSSGNQGLYDQTQRYYNDLMSRNYGNLLGIAEQMAGNEYNMLADQLSKYHTAYGLGQDYSNIERYNNAVKQNNAVGNQIAGASSAIGKVFSAIPLPWTQAVGAALQGAGALGSTDVSNLTSKLGYGSAPSSQVYDQGTLGNITNIFNEQTLQNLFGNKTPSVGNTQVALPSVFANNQQMQQSTANINKINNGQLGTGSSGFGTGNFGFNR